MFSLMPGKKSKRGISMVIQSMKISLESQSGYFENNIWLENTCVRHTETLDNVFDHIRPDQQCRPWFLRLDIEPATTGWRYRTLPLSHRSTPMPNELLMAIVRLINLNVSFKLHSYSLQRTRSPPGQRLPKRIGNTHTRNYYTLKGKEKMNSFFFK